MVEKTGVVGYRKVGSSEKMLEDEKIKAPDLTLAEAVERWDHLKEEVRHLPWSEVPDEMLQDFLKASSGHLMAGYADKGLSKAAEILAITLGSVSAGDIVFEAGWSQTSARLNVVISRRKYDEQVVDPMVEFQVRVPDEAMDDDVRQALQEWADKRKPQERFILDPVNQVLVSDLRALVLQVEGAVVDENEEDRNFNTLFCSAALLVIWKAMEDQNAATADWSLSGLTKGNEKVAVGEEVVIRVTRVPLDVAPEFQEDEEGYKIATIRKRLTR